VKVFKRILSIADEKATNKLKTSKETLDIFRAQGALNNIKDTDKIIENIRGNY
jgi:hypothetical protein